MTQVGHSPWTPWEVLHTTSSGSRIAGGLEATRLNVPRIAGSVDVWGGLFSACDCVLVYVRKNLAV
jgi:mitochondrial import inner membrane translocase subunit TIM17